MMRLILVPHAQDFADQPALEAAFSIGKRMNSHIRAMFVRPDPAVRIHQIPDVIAAAGVTCETIEREGRQIAYAGQVRFDAWRARHEIPELPGKHHTDVCSADWVERVGEIDEIVTQFGRISDLIIMSRFGPSDVVAERCFDAAVFGTGRPTLVVTDNPPHEITEHIMIAWNGSLEAARAVAGAMPLLRLAKRVSIFTALKFERETADLADLGEALVWHGIRTPAVVFPKNDQPTGAALLAAASQQGATLIVMGAYTHSRLRQKFLGGVTEQVLAAATIPFLMSH